MPDQTVSDYRQWIRRSARPIYYGPLERWSDWRNGRLDGKAGLPALPPGPSADNPSGHEPAEQHPSARTDEPDIGEPDAAEGDEPGRSDAGDNRERAEEPVPEAGPEAWPDVLPPTNTPYIAALAHAFHGRASGERIRFEARTALLRQRLQRAQVEARALDVRLAQAQERLKAASEAPPPASLRERRTVEITRSRPDHLVRTRRLADHARQRAAAEAAFLEVEEPWRATTATIAELTAQVGAERLVAAQRVRRLYEHCQRRVACYWRHLVHHHEQGLQINARLRPAGPHLPAWAREDGTTDEEDGR